MAQLAARLHPMNGQPHTIDENVTFADEDIQIATYNAQYGRRSITDRDFVLHFNQRIIRSMPRNTVALVRAVEDFVVEEVDYAAAIVARLDQVPKFVQDRRNFELKEALTFYEQEALAPQISPAELQAYYSENGERYKITNEATGILYKFTSDAAAADALQRLVQDETEAATKHTARVLDPVVVRRDGSPLARDRPNALLLAMPDGRPFGPFQHEGEATIFVKRVSGPMTIPPLSEIEEAIRQTLLREKLDARELQLFEERGTRHALRVHFNFSDYGINNPLDQR
jgi:hypothetical protein